MEVSLSRMEERQWGHEVIQDEVDDEILYRVRVGSGWRVHTIYTVDVW